MENRFLCRGKRIDNSEWVQGVPSYGEDGKIEEIEVWDGEINRANSGWNIGKRELRERNIKNLVFVLWQKA